MSRPINVPELGKDVPRRGNRLLAWFGRVGMRLGGWSFQGTIPNMAKAVVIVVPHTSNWDFPVGVAGMFAVGVRVSWLGKHTLFKGPMGSVMKWLGGISVDRSASAGVVDQIIELFNARDQMLLGLSPEGTRSRVERWRTGFYHIAHGADVPIFPIAFDWSTRSIRFGQKLQPSGDVAGDIRVLEEFFSGAVGRRPENMAPTAASGSG